MRAMSENNSNVDQMMCMALKKKKNTERQAENAIDQHFLLFSIGLSGVLILMFVRR